MIGLERLLDAFANAGVEFIVIGGIAARAHGSARVTQDVDVVYARSDRNIRRLVDALAPFRPCVRGAPPGLPFEWSTAAVTAGLNFTLATTIGDKYLVTSPSVARHIAQIEELHAFDIVATDRDLSRQVATPVAPQQSAQTTPADHATEADDGRHGPTGKTEVSRYVERLEREVEQAKDERDFLREQIDRKDKTIDSLIERDRETNILVRGLQEMLTPLLGPIRREPRASDEQHGVH
jgi:hypothetical protein